MQLWSLLPWFLSSDLAVPNDNSRNILPIAANGGGLSQLQSARFVAAVAGVRRCHTSPVNGSETNQPTAAASSSSRIFLVSIGLFAACAGLLIAYRHGFRVFDGTHWNNFAKEQLILSIPEMLVLFGSIALGVVAAIAALVSAITWLPKRCREQLRSLSLGLLGVVARVPRNLRQ
jgi:hypothetical protein